MQVKSYSKKVFREGKKKDVSYLHLDKEGKEEKRSERQVKKLMRKIGEKKDQIRKENQKTFEGGSMTNFSLSLYCYNCGRLCGIDWVKSQIDKVVRKENGRN